MDFDINGLIGDIDVSVHCPICNHEFELKTSKFLNEAVIECPNCNNKIQLETKRD